MYCSRQKSSENNQVDVLVRSDIIVILLSATACDTAQHDFSQLTALPGFDCGLWCACFVWSVQAFFCNGHVGLNRQTVWKAD